MDIEQFRLRIRTHNFERTTTFYGEALALPRLDDWETDRLRGVLYQAGSGVLEVIGRRTGAEPRRLRDEAFDYQGPKHKMELVLLVDSAEKAYKDIVFREQNIPGGLREDSDGTLVFETHDPDGVKILYRETKAD